MDIGKSSKIVLAIVTIIMLQLPSSHSFKPRRVLFAGCYEDVVKPITVFMTCANNHGVCEVRRGNTHNLRVFFKPRVNSSDIESNAAWNNGWFPISLPNQEADACKFLYKCPLQANLLTSFTYNLTISSYWPASEFPVIWKLTDKETSEEVLCLKFKIDIK